MNLEEISDKHLGELELLSRELLTVIRKSHLEEAALVTLLTKLEKEAGELRRVRFDAHDSKYNGF